MNLSFLAYPVLSKDAPVCAHAINTRLHNMLLTQTSVAWLDPRLSPRVFGCTTDTITSVMSSAALNAASEKLSAISSAFGLNIVTTEACRFDPRTQECQALSDAPGHVVTADRAGPLHSTRSVSFVWRGTRLGALLTTLRLNAPLDAQLLPVV